jgi:hypothetical protein
MIVVVAVVNEGVPGGCGNEGEFAAAAMVARVSIFPGEGGTKSESRFEFLVLFTSSANNGRCKENECDVGRKPKVGGGLSVVDADEFESGAINESGSSCCDCGSEEGDVETRGEGEEANMAGILCEGYSIRSCSKVKKRYVSVSVTGEEGTENCLSVYETSVRRIVGIGDGWMKKGEEG